MIVLSFLITEKPNNLSDYNNELLAVEKLVIRGVNVEVEQYPYTAQLVIEDTSVCGGALISKRVVVTAAHCLVDDDNRLISPNDMDVYLGNLKRYNVTLT